jgi:hypothetical protein
MKLNLHFLQGNIPPQLNPQSALKLMEMFDELRASTSQELLRKTAKLAEVVQPIQRDEKNQLLREKVKLIEHSTFTRFRAAVQSQIRLSFKLLAFITVSLCDD